MSRLTAMQRTGANNLINDPVAYERGRTRGLSEEIRGLQKAFLERWIKGENGAKFLVRRPSVPCLHWLHTGRKCNKADCGSVGIFSWLDHYEFWVDSERMPFAIVSHPYHFNARDGEEMSKICRELKLHYYVGAQSWYFPRSSLLVVIQTDRKGYSI